MLLSCSLDGILIMNLIRKFIGPKSKYKDDIPYTYEARVNIIENEPEYNSYIADTICALVEYLESNNLKPEDVKIYEIFKTEEKPLDVEFCISDEGSWLTRNELCKSFKQHYPGHIGECGCTFEDRERDVSGP